MDFCSIASGSSGNCIFVGTDHINVLIDAGISGKRVTEGLHAIDRDPKELDAILITHEHSDHIKGLGVLARKYGIPVYSTQGTIHTMLEQNMLGKVDSSLFHAVAPDVRFEIGELGVLPFRVSHDAAEPVAYRFHCGEKSVAVATDLGYYDDYMKQRILGRKGHLSNDNAGRLLGEILNDRMKAVMLGHLSRENNYEALAMATVCTEITDGNNPYKATDFPIRIAKRDEPSELIAV